MFLKVAPSRPPQTKGAEVDGMKDGRVLDEGLPLTELEMEILFGQKKVGTSDIGWMISR